jgi:hypothetical protein
MDSFRQNPSDLAKGRHMIIAAAKDANGLSGQGCVQINVMKKDMWQQTYPSCAGYCSHASLFGQIQSWLFLASIMFWFSSF